MTTWLHTRPSKLTFIGQHAVCIRKQGMRQLQSTQRTAHQPYDKMLFLKETTQDVFGTHCGRTLTATSFDVCPHPSEACGIYGTRIEDEVTQIDMFRTALDSRQA